MYEDFVEDSSPEGYSQEWLSRCDEQRMHARCRCRCRPCRTVRGGRLWWKRALAVKVHLSYPEPVWRDHGLSGWSVSAQGPLLSTVDDSPADESGGILTGFVTGKAATTFRALSPEVQRDAVLAHDRRLFPSCRRRRDAR